MRVLSGLPACRERQMCRMRSRCCLLASDGRRSRDSRRDVEEEEKEEDGKLILMLSNWLRVDVFEIPLQRKKKWLDRCSGKNSSAAKPILLLAGWPAVGVGAQVHRGQRRIRWRRRYLGWACSSGLVVGGVIGASGSRQRSGSADIHSKW